MVLFTPKFWSLFHVTINTKLRPCRATPTIHESQAVLYCFVALLFWWNEICNFHWQKQCCEDGLVSHPGATEPLEDYTKFNPPSSADGANKVAIELLVLLLCIQHMCKARAPSTPIQSCDSWRCGTFTGRPLFYVLDSYIAKTMLMADWNARQNVWTNKYDIKWS